MHKIFWLIFGNGINLAINGLSFVESLLAVGIAQGVIGGIAGYFGAKAKAKVAKAESEGLRAEADAITGQIERIKDFVEANKINPNEALARIAKIFDAAGAQMKEAIKIGTTESITQMQEAYGWSVKDLNVQLGEFREIMDKESKSFRKEWGEGFDKMQSALIQRRLGASEASRAAGAKELEKLQLGQKEIGERRAKVEEEGMRRKARLGEQLQSNIRGVRAGGRAELLRMLGGQAIARGQMEEQAIRGAQMTNLGLGQWELGQEISGERQQGILRGRAGVLGEESKISPWLGALGGLAGSGAGSSLGLAALLG